MSKEFPKCEHTHEVLKQLQALPLSQKIFETRLRIAEWIKIWGEENVYVSFSGGKDSTVLLDMVRKDYPNIMVVFCDTGLEFPEIVDFVKTYENITWIKPKMTFKKVLEHYGWPLISKKMAQYIGEVQRTKSEHLRKLRLTGIRKDGTYSSMAKISQKWQWITESKIKISDKCCDALKKKPFAQFEKKGMKPIMGVMAGESLDRSKGYIRYGCNAFELSRPRSAPMMFWSDDDVWEYIRTKDLPYSTIYDMGYPRTGCMFCAFGAHLEKSPNRFQTMELTHPKQWNYCMNKLGMADVLDKIGVPHKREPELFDEEK